MDENTNLGEVVESLMKANKFFRYLATLFFVQALMYVSAVTGNNKKRILQSYVRHRAPLFPYKQLLNSLVPLYFHLKPSYIVYPHNRQQLHEQISQEVPPLVVMMALT